MPQISLTDVIIAAALKAAPSFELAATILRRDGHAALAVKETARAEMLRALAADDEVAERLAGALRTVEGSPLLAPTGPSPGAALETGYAHALNVVANWSAGDLAGAVNGLEEWAEALPGLFPDLSFTPFDGDDGEGER